MYYELYIDVLFLVNFLMDVILLLIAGKVLKVRVPVGRIFLGALAGALLLCLVTALRIPAAALRWVLFYSVIPAAMLFAGLGIQTLRQLLRGFLVLYAGGFLVGGIFTCFRQYVQAGSLFFALAAACYYLASGIFRFLELLFRFENSRCQVALEFAGKCCRGQALIDTGNHLTDPVSGKAVSIISRGMAERLFGEGLPEGIRYIPCRTVRKESGVLPAVVIDRIRVEDEEQWIEAPVIAVSGRSSFENECDVILHPDI